MAKHVDGTGNPAAKESAEKRGKSMAVYRIRRLFLTMRINGLRGECKPL
jgi:hypothetical protein